MHTGLGKVFSLEESVPAPPTIVDCDMLRQYALEAEVNTYCTCTCTYTCMHNVHVHVYVLCIHMNTVLEIMSSNWQFSRHFASVRTNLHLTGQIV